MQQLKKCIDFRHNKPPNNFLFLIPENALPVFNKRYKVFPARESIGTGWEDCQG